VCCLQVLPFLQALSRQPSRLWLHQLLPRSWAYIWNGSITERAAPAMQGEHAATVRAAVAAAAAAAAGQHEPASSSQRARAGSAPQQQHQQQQQQQQQSHDSQQAPAAAVPPAAPTGGGASARLSEPPVDAGDVDDGEGADDEIESGSESG
jgi:hypothetical protein